METIQVTTSRGTLYERVFKDSQIQSENVNLNGNKMKMLEGKITNISGTVTKKDGTTIGSFIYNNSDNDPMFAEGGYKCEVVITDEGSATLQVEATRALLAGIGELTKEDSL